MYVNMPVPWVMFVIDIYFNNLQHFFPSIMDPTRWFQYANVWVCQGRPPRQRPPLEGLGNRQVFPLIGGPPVKFTHNTHDPYGSNTVIICNNGF